MKQGIIEDTRGKKKGKKVLINFIGTPKSHKKFIPPTLKKKHHWFYTQVKDQGSEVSIFHTIIWVSCTLRVELNF